MHEVLCPHCNKSIPLDDAGYAEILGQVRNEQFEKELHARLAEVEQRKEAEIALAEAAVTQRLKDELALKETALAELKTKFEASDLERKLAIQEALKPLETERDALKGEVARADLEKQVALKDAETVTESRIAELRTRLEEAQKFNLSLSTQGIGEELEKHCRDEFDKIRATAFPRAYFEKDTEVKDGTKGDFVFRDFDENGVEIISIMFEMKNESDSSTTRSKNEKFYPKLDEDRTKKGCEYAILVTSLEKESALFNSGIVDVSHRFEKMLVIRPQFFIPIITTLRNAALKSLQTKRELELVKAQNVDITSFEKELNEFKLDAERIYGWAKDRFGDAIEAINDAIKELELVKTNLLLSQKHLGAANTKAQDLTIRKLTIHNPTMKQKFDDLAD